MQLKTDLIFAAFNVAGGLRDATFDANQGFGLGLSVTRL
jgi:hypothetical protein